MKRYPATKDYKAERVATIRAGGGSIVLRQCGDGGILLVTEKGDANEPPRQAMVYLTEKALRHLRVTMRKP